MSRFWIAIAISAASVAAASGAEVQDGTCKALAAPAHQYAADAAAFLAKAKTLRMTPDQDFAAVFSGPELEAARALAATYGPLMPQLEAYASQITIFSTVMDACAKK